MPKYSAATQRNFSKLNKDLNTHQFTSRANKRDSQKLIIPAEYYTDKANIETITAIVQTIKSYDKQTAIDSLILSFLSDKKIITKTTSGFTSEFPFLQDFVNTLNYSEGLLDVKLPLTEQDPLGLVYQQLITEGEKNKRGSYYTPRKIVQNLLNIHVQGGQSFCDPCCGTGSFLLPAGELFAADKIYGFDLDPTAVKIARANLFARHPEVNYNQNISCCNFLLEPPHHFDYIITNPPWGSMNNGDSLPCTVVEPKTAVVEPVETTITSGESFSYFIERALQSLTAVGHLHFLLPVSILNVKAHQDIRNYILQNGQIDQVTVFGKCFKGVLTDVIGLKLSAAKPTETYTYNVVLPDRTFSTSIQNVLNDKNHNISMLDQTDYSIIQKIEEKAALNLKDAQFALGIVTGNNAELLKQSPAPNLRPIITGKEVQKYYTLEPANFIEYKRENFQQICPEWFFQAPIKFLYKFISKRLVFALDETKLLTLNSANMFVLPQNFPLNKYAVLALLNSDFMNFYFSKTVNQVKVLKDDIQNLPLPLLSQEQQETLSKLVQDCINSPVKNYEPIESFFFDFYRFSDDEIRKIVVSTGSTTAH